MSGIDEILNMIGTQQKENEDRILSAASTKVAQILKEADEKSAKAYEVSLERARTQHRRSFENSCTSVDTEMKRRVLDCKVELIDEAISNVLARLKALPDKEYFGLLKKIIVRHLKPEEGTLYLGKRDLARLPSGFDEEINTSAKNAGGSLIISKEPVDITDGFVLEYGLISENCGFSAVLEAEKDTIRDIAARHLFG